MQGASVLALWPVTQRWWVGSALMVFGVGFAVLSDFFDALFKSRANFTHYSYHN